MDITCNIKFEDLGISKNIIQSILKKGYVNPTPIQKEIIPLFLNTNENIIGKAKTGTGKTAAFGIPIIQKITEKNGKIQAIIITPTRELAIQISEELKTFGGIENLFILCVFGGQSINFQIKQLSKNPDIIVGTPGRIIDLIKKQKLNLSNLSFFVLDEADEMLNMGFINDVEEILKSTPKMKRMLFLSATMPKTIVRIAKKYMGDYKQVFIDEIKEEVKLTDQFEIETKNNIKFDCLCRILDSIVDFYGIIFCGRKDTASNVSSKLLSLGYCCSSIHGDIIQEQRMQIMDLFKKQKINILVATDVAARGLDVNNLTHVINYDVPQDSESYIHRIGRTGRAGKKGIAITIFTNSEQKRLNMIKKIIGTKIKKMDLLSSEKILLIKQNKLISQINKLLEDEDTDKKEYNSFLETLLETTKKDSRDILICLLKKFYSNSITIQEKELKRDILLSNDDTKRNNRRLRNDNNNYKKNNKRYNKTTIQKKINE